MPPNLIWYRALRDPLLMERLREHDARPKRRDQADRPSQAPVTTSRRPWILGDVVVSSLPSRKKRDPTALFRYRAGPGRGYRCPIQQGGYAAEHETLAGGAA